ncbi:hypothetical protein ACTXJT_13610 [Corynebacterium casei]|uniref:hypothetical protein n=1 Tax=Corynebacterium casei TaxID=160386 RepID=UPI003FCF5F9E
MKIPMLVVLVGILSGIVTGLLVAFGFGPFAAGFPVAVIAGLLAFLYWRVRLALAKLLSNARSIQHTLEQLGDFEKRLRKLQSSVSNLESATDASTSRVRRDISHESGILKSELLRINAGLQASAAQLRDEVSVGSSVIESRFAHQNELVESSTTRVRRDISHESGILKSELLRINAGLQASTGQLRDEVSVGSSEIESRIAQLGELADALTRRIRNDLKTQGRETNALIERNHGARLKESDNNSRLLSALDKQRDLLGTLVINSDFQFKNETDQNRIGQMK